MSAISRNLLLSAVLFLVLVPSASAAVNMSDAEVQAGETLSFSGSMHVLDCTNGDANLRVLLKEPAGGHVQIHPEIKKKETLQGSGQYTYRSISFEFRGSLHINESWPTGEYELVADGYYHCYSFYNQPVTWIGDKKESARFTVSGYGPEKDWMQSSGKYVNSFQLDGIRQTELIVSAHQSADCWVNGHKAASGISSGRVDITRYLQPGSNDVVCSVNAGYENVCSLSNGEACGCHCWSKYRFCGQSTWFWDCPSNVRKTQTQFYVVAQPSFSGTVAQHREEDVLWSNDGSTWYYSRLPVTDGTMFLDRPDYYSTDTIYQGTTPWTSGRAYFSKQLFSEEAEGILAASSLLEPDCTLNGKPVAFELVDDGWWVFQAEVQLEEQNHLLCSVERNGEFNLFDASLLQNVEGEPITAVPVGSPFHYSSGESADGPGGWFSSASSGLAAASSGAGKGLSGFPLAPIGVAALASAGAVGLSGQITRKRKVPKGTGSRLPVFWERVRSMKEQFLKRKEKEEEFNSMWSSHLEATKIYWKAQDIMKRVVSQRIALLSGNNSSINSSVISATVTIPGNMTVIPATGVSINQGTPSFEEMIYADYYGGLDGMLRWAKDSLDEYFEGVGERAIFMGEKELDADWGRQAAAFSYNGLFLKELGETTYNVGFSIGMAGLAAITCPPAAAMIEEASSAIIISGGIMASAGIVMKTIGDKLQHDVCHQTGNMGCALKADEEIKWNLMEGSMEILFTVTKAKAARSVVSTGKNALSKILGKKYTKKLVEYMSKHTGMDELELKAEKIVQDGMEVAKDWAMDSMKDSSNKYFREE